MGYAYGESEVAAHSASLQAQMKDRQRQAATFKAHTEYMQRLRPQVQRMYDVQDNVVDDGWVPNAMKKDIMLIRKAAQIVSHGERTGSSPRKGHYVLPDYGRDPLAQSILSGDESLLRRAHISTSPASLDILGRPATSPAGSGTGGADSSPSAAAGGVGLDLGNGNGPLLPPPVRRYA